jgi:desulfoferrodoxin-like iron-binding protein
MAERNQIFQCETDGLIVEVLNGSSRIVAREYCNLHGLWRVKA